MPAACHGVPFSIWLGTDQAGRIPSVPQPVEIEQPLLIKIYVGGFGIFWCVALLGGIVASVADGAIGALVPLLLMLAFGATLCYRIFSLEAIADTRGLRVRNYFSTKTFDWDDVEDFRLGGPMFSMPFGKVVHVLLRDREIVTLDVTMRPWLLSSGRRKLDGWLQMLREWPQGQGS